MSDTVTVTTPAGEPIYRGRLLGRTDVIDIDDLVEGEPVVCLSFDPPARIFYREEPVPPGTKPLRRPVRHKRRGPL